MSTARYSVWISYERDDDYEWMDKITEVLQSIPGFVECSFEDSYDD
jgi:hypothetical protein